MFMLSLNSAVVMYNNSTSAIIHAESYMLYTDMKKIILVTV